MNKKDVQKLYKSQIKLFKKYNKFYFDQSKPIVSDEEYDNLKQEILKLEKDYDFLNSKDSPSNLIGHKPSKNFKKDFHRVPMLSLANAFSEEDLLNFEKKTLNYLSEKDD